MQTSYTDVRAKAVPGLLFGNPADSYIDGDYVAGEAIEPGRVLVRDATTGKLKVPVAAFTVDQIAGVSVYQTTVQQAVFASGGTGGGYTYAVNSKVPVLRKGRIWVQVASASEPTGLVLVNVKRSSTIATDRGKVSTDATNTTSGTEIDTVPNGAARFIEKATTTLWLVEFNLP